MNVIGNINQFAIGYEFFDVEHVTELSLFVNDSNILEFSRKNVRYTTRWNLDELALWLREFIDNMKEDPYPVQCDGDYAAMKDIKAREFDSDDDDEFDAYFERLYEWDSRHRWHSASSGAILADVYFQQVGEFVEISWNNSEIEDQVEFAQIIGGCRVDRKTFYAVTDEFLKAYANHWYN